MKLYFSILIFLISSVAISQSRGIILEPLYAPFYHGVASGDPKSDSIIIWTRITPDSSQTGSLSVNWTMATDSSMQNIIQSGISSTDSDKDHTIKIDVRGLLPYTQYYYEIEHTHLGEMIRFLHLNRGPHVIRIKILKEEVCYHHFD